MRDRMADTGNVLDNVRELLVVKATGESLSLELPSSTEVAAVKDAVEKAWNIPRGQQQLVNGSDILPDTFQISELEDNCSLTLVRVPWNFVGNQWFELSNDGLTATKVGTVLWRTVEIGDWMVHGRHIIKIKLDSLAGATVQPPGVSIALGVLFRIHELKSTPFNEGGHWSVATTVDDQPRHGVEYLGNKWGTSYGERLAEGDTVEILVDMDTRTLGFSRNGKDQGICSDDLPAEGVRFAVALEGGSVSIAS